MKPIGHIRSEFAEKFGIPKQPGLAPSLRATLVLEGEWAHETCWRGLEECSHLWVIFHFHDSEPFRGGTVRPPVLGGEKRMGVFSTRSPHRPNPIGLSLVRRGTITAKGQEAHIEVFGHDFLDGTPILDIKPYLVSYDTPVGEVRHWTDSVEQKRLEVCWDAPAPESIRQRVEEVLRLDPRPRQGGTGPYGLYLDNYNVVFEIADSTVVIKRVASAGISPKAK